MTETLTAEHLTDGWTVIDPDGGRWWPDENAKAEVEDSEDPAEAIVTICTTAPARGRWHC